MPNTSAIKRGFHYDAANTRLSVYVDGTEVAYFDKTNGLGVAVDGFNLAGQTITAGISSGSTDYSTMIGHYSSGDGSANEASANMLVIKVGGTTYYVPAFTSV